MKWTRQTQANEEPTVYQSENGDIVKYKAGDEPWTYAIYKATTVSQAMALKVIEEHDCQGLRQHDFKGGYDEATKTLTV